MSESKHIAEFFEHESLVFKVLNTIKNRYTFENDEQAIVSAGRVGLWNAIINFRAVNGCSLKSWAWIKIRGAMLDEIRFQDPLSRRMRQQCAMEKAERPMVLHISAPISNCEDAGLDEVLAAEDNEYIHPHDAKFLLKEALAAMSDQENQVCELYFFKHLKLLEIGNLLSVTESRVSQIVKEGITRARNHLVFKNLIET